MNEQDKLSEQDIETLQRVEALLASPQPAQNGATEVSVLLVSTVPQADPAFKSQLETQLLAKLDGRRVQKSEEDRPAASRNVRPATLLKRAPLAPGIPFNQAAGRFGSALVGAAMVAALVLALAFLLQSRRDTPNIAQDGTATAIALGTQTITKTETSPAAAITIETKLLRDNFIIWSPDGRSRAPAIAWSPDGSNLASSSPDGLITFWDSATGQKLREIDTSSNGTLSGISWSPQARILASSSTNGSTFQGLVALWDTDTGKQLNSFIQTQGRVTSMAWSPDGRILAWTDGWTITRWDQTTGTALPKPQPTWPAPITTAGIEPNLVTNLAWSSDGSKLATSQTDIIKIWDPTIGQELATLSHSGSVSQIAWSSTDDSILAALVASQDNPTRLVLWDTLTNQERQVPVIEGNISSIAWLPRGLVLAISVLDDKTGNDYVSRYDAITGQLVRITDGIATELAWSPDNHTLAIANSGDGLITLMDAFAELQPSPTPAVANSPTMTQVAVVGTPSPSVSPRVLRDCWDGWDVSVGPNTAIAGTKRGSSISLADVAAIEYRDVWAVGSSRDSDALAKTLTAHWDGEKWTLVPSPNKSEEFGYQALHAVAALSSTDVWAVGDYTSSNAAPQETLIQHWDGAKWSIVRSPSPGTTNSLTALAAASPNDIWAVGYTSHDNGPMETLTLHWDGQKWSVLPTPAVGTASGLQSVVAISANDAWAVGWSQGDGGDASSINVGLPLTMHWDGKQWNVVAVPGVENAQLTGVSASPIGDLWAVGYKADGNGTEPLVLHWDEIQWNVVPTPKLKSNDSVYNINVFSNVFSDEDVWVVGAQVMHWDGRTWTVQRGTGWSDVILSGMAVFWRTDIWAVGSLRSNPKQPLVLYYSTGYQCAGLQTPAGQLPEATASTLGTPAGTTPGSGRPTPSIPLPVATSVPTAIPVATSGCDPHWDILRLTGETVPGATNLVDLAAVSENDIWAIGSRTASDPGSFSSQTLAMHWDGADWTTVPTPNKGEGLNYLMSISAVTSNDVWAIGSYAARADAPYELLALHWNGREWAIMPGSNPGQHISLGAVDAASKDDIWALGASDTGPLTMHWNGKTWSAIPVPKIGKFSSRLSALVAVASDDVWAVGSYQDVRPTQEAPVPSSALTMHWDGKTWSLVPVPDSSITELTGITATGPKEVWAIGARQRDQVNMWEAEMVVLRWDGSKWSTVPIPKLEMANSRGKIVAVSAQDVWAFGSRTLHWDGTRWTRVYEPQIEVTDWIGKRVEDVPVYDAAATPGGTVWALGRYVWSNTPGPPLQIIARYNYSPCSSPPPGVPNP